MGIWSRDKIVCVAVWNRLFTLASKRYRTYILGITLWVHCNCMFSNWKSSLWVFGPEIKLTIVLSSEYSCYNQSRDLHPDLFSLEEGKAFCFEPLWFREHVSYKLQSLVMLWFDWHLFLSCCDLYKYHLKLKYLLNVMYIVFFRLFYKRNMKPKYW